MKFKSNFAVALFAALSLRAKTSSALRGLRKAGHCLSHYLISKRARFRLW